MRIQICARTLAVGLLGVAAIATSGCGNALVYGEGTNFSLTTLRLNDDPATPVRIVSGLDRTIAAIAPRQGNGKDAVNMASNFNLEHAKGDAILSVFSDTLKITSEFASGEAAIKKESGSENVVASPLATEVLLK